MIGNKAIRISYLRATITVAIAFVCGLVGLALVFTDIGPSDTLAGRTTASALFFVVAGLVLGVLNPRGRWWLLAGLAAWGMVVLGLAGIAASISDAASGDLGLAVMFLSGPLVCALVGGFLGARLARARLARSSSRGEPAR